MDQDQPESEAPHDRRTFDCLDTCSCLLHGNVRRDPSWIARRSLNPQRPEQSSLPSPDDCCNFDAGLAEKCVGWRHGC